MPTNSKYPSIHLFIDSQSHCTTPYRCCCLLHRPRQSTPSSRSLLLSRLAYALSIRDGLPDAWSAVELWTSSSTRCRAARSKTHAHTWSISEQGESVAGVCICAFDYLLGVGSCGDVQPQMPIGVCLSLWYTKDIVLMMTMISNSSSSSSSTTQCNKSCGPRSHQRSGLMDGWIVLIFA